MSEDTWRGHSINQDKDRDVWVYGDGIPVSDWPDRPCGFCGLENTSEGHDGCLGTLPDVMNACCGHGHDKPWVQFPDGSVLTIEPADKERP